MSRLPQPRITTDGYGHKMIDGETYMGGIRVPMMPNRIALLDKTTGQYRVLSHTEGAVAIDLVAINIGWSDVTKVTDWYAGLWTLTLDNGVLAFTLGTVERTAGKILTRRAYDRTVLELTPDTSGSVVYTPYTL